MGQGSKFTSHWYDKIECPNCVQSHFEIRGECVWRASVWIYSKKWMKNNNNDNKIKGLLSVNPAADKWSRVSGLRLKRAPVLLSAELVHDLWKVFTKHWAMIIKGQGVCVCGEGAAPWKGGPAWIRTVGVWEVDEVALWPLTSIPLVHSEQHNGWHLCPFSAGAIIIYISQRGRQKEARGAVKQSAPASCQQHPSLSLSLPLFFSPYRCLPPPLLADSPSAGFVIFNRFR